MSLCDDVRPLAGTRVRLRPATETDVAAFTALFRDPGVTLWWPAPDPEAEARDHAGRHSDEPDGAQWAIEWPAAPAGTGLLGSEVIGLVQAYEETDPDFRHASIDIALASTAQGLGLGPDAVRAVARFLFDVRGHHRLIIDPAASNERAIRAYASVGFRPVGVMRAYQRLPAEGWVDALLMDLLAGELREAESPGG